MSIRDRRRSSSVVRDHLVEIEEVVAQQDIGAYEGENVQSDAYWFVRSKWDEGGVYELGDLNVGYVSVKHANRLWTVVQVNSRILKKGRPKVNKSPFRPAIQKRPDRYFFLTIYFYPALHLGLLLVVYHGYRGGKRCRGKSDVIDGSSFLTLADQPFSSSKTVVPRTARSFTIGLSLLLGQTANWWSGERQIRQRRLSRLHCFSFSLIRLPSISQSIGGSPGTIDEGLGAGVGRFPAIGKRFGEMVGAMKGGRTAGVIGDGCVDTGAELERGPISRLFFSIWAADIFSSILNPDALLLEAVEIH